MSNGADATAALGVIIKLASDSSVLEDRKALTIMAAIANNFLKLMKLYLYHNLKSTGIKKNIFLYTANIIL